MFACMSDYAIKNLMDVEPSNELIPIGGRRPAEGDGARVEDFWDD